MFIEIDPTLTNRINKLQEDLEKESKELKELKEKLKKEQDQELKLGKIESYLNNRDKHSIPYKERIKFKNENPSAYNQLYGETIIPKTKADFDKLTCSQRTLLYNTHKELYKKFINM